MIDSFVVGYISSVSQASELRLGFVSFVCLQKWSIPHFMDDWWWTIGLWANIRQIQFFVVLSGWLSQLSKQSKLESNLEIEIRNHQSLHISAMPAMQETDLPKTSVKLFSERLDPDLRRVFVLVQVPNWWVVSGVFGGCSVGWLPLKSLL